MADKKLHHRSAVAGALVGFHELCIVDRVVEQLNVAVKTRCRRLNAPDGSLIREYCEEGDYSDCYGIDVAGQVTLAEFVTAFYTTWVFRLERWILCWAANRPSSDADVRALAADERDTFAAWKVEARREDEVLLTDFLGNTRSWLMVVPGAGTTRLLFGSIVVAWARGGEGGRRLRWRFRVLLGFHRVYSRVLLRAGAGRLGRRGRGKRSRTP